MTTPERLRRRQQLELRGLIFLGVLLLILGLTQILTTAYFRGQDKDQRACIADNLGRLAQVLTTRGDIANREAKAARLEAKASRLESRALNQSFLPEAFAATTQAEVFNAYGEYRAQLAEVNDMRAKVDNRRAQIRIDREKSPIPDFPEGRCE